MSPYYDEGGITIWHGDCREVTAWLEADVLITDPPYGVSYRSGWLDRTILNDHDTSARNQMVAMWGTKSALVFGQWSQPKPTGTRLTLVWDKGDWPGMGDLALPWGPSTEEVYVLGSGFVGKRSGTVIRQPRLSGNTSHPNEKPVALLRRLLGKCPPGAVADPFMGSGTTLRAAKDLGRRAIGVEVEERYCEIAARRLGQEVLALDGVA